MKDLERLHWQTAAVLGEELVLKHLRVDLVAFELCLLVHFLDVHDLRERAVGHVTEVIHFPIFTRIYY